MLNNIGQKEISVGPTENTPPFDDDSSLTIAF